MRASASTERSADGIDVAFPARAKYVSVARFAAAAVAARQGFSYDDIEDLKIAVSEACNALIGAAKSGRHAISLRLTPEDGAITARIAAPGTRLSVEKPGAREPRRPLDEGALGVFLMECLVDSVDIRHTEGQAVITLRVAKGRREGLHAG
jgi:serine/threonine-protein kinase RsbW